MAISLKKVMSLTTRCTSALLILTVSNHLFAMDPFQANYQFSYNGKNMGSASRTLTQQSGNNWMYDFSAKAGVIASAQEVSKFSLNNNQINAQHFNRTSKILIHSNTTSITFSPSNKMIYTQKDNDKRSFAWTPGVLDELNAELQIREDLKHGGLKSKYLIADAKGVDTRHFVKQANESIKTPYGTFNAIKVVMQHDKPERSTIFWLAPKLDYLPVKVSHIDGKSSYGLLLTQYSGKTN